MTMKIVDVQPNRGFTIIELVTFIVIAGIFVPLAFVAFSAVTKSAAKPEQVITARFIAEQKIEEITKQKFVNIGTSTSYATVTGNPGYEWRKEIINLGYGDVKKTYVNQYGITMAYYETSLQGANTNIAKITVYVKDPSNWEYVVSTIATKRPGDE